MSNMVEFSSRFYFFVVLKRDLFVYRDDSLRSRGGLSCEPNNQLYVCTKSETGGEVVYVKLV